MCKRTLIIIVLPLIVLAAEWQALNGPSLLDVAHDMSMGIYEGQWVIYVANQGDKLYKSTNLGESWDSLPPPEAPPNPDIINPTCVITDKDNVQLVYIGKHDCETQPPDPFKVIFKSEDGGQNWINVNQSGDITNWKAVCFAMHPTSSQILYAGFDAQCGTQCFYKTTNGGNSWDPCGDFPQSVTVRDIWIDANSPNNLYIASSEGIYQSINNGANWSQLPQPPNSNDIHCLTVNEDLANPTLFIGNASGYDAWIYYTTNNGGDWYLGTHETGEIDVRPTGIEVEENTNGQDMYATIHGTGFYKSEDGGDSWRRNNKAIFDSLTLKCLLQHPALDNKIFIGSHYAIYIYYGSGDWFERTKGMRLAKMNDICAVDGNIAETSIELCALNKSTNAGENWQWIYFDHQTTVTDVEIAPSDVNIIYSSYLDQYAIPPRGSVIKTTNGGFDWTVSLLDWDVVDVSVFKTNPDYAHACGHTWDPNPVTWYTTNGGDNWWPRGFGFTGKFLTIESDPLQMNVVYVGGYSLQPEVYKSTDGGQGWYRKSDGFLHAGKLFNIAIDPINTQNLFASSNHGLYKSINASELWKRKNDGLTEYYSTDVEIDPEEPTIAYALTQVDANSTTNLLYCTVDGAAKWFKFTLEAGHNPPVYINDLAIDNSQADRLYATTLDEGTFTFYPQYINKHLTSSSNVATSINSGKKMIRGGINDFWITYESGGVIYAVHSSDGGMSWSRKMEIGEGYNPAISFDPNPETPIPGIVWWAQGTRDTIYFARHISDYNWAEPTPIVTTDYDFGPPSFVIGTDGKGRLVYTNTEHNHVYYTEFDFYNPVPSTDPDFGSGINPSIGFMNPGGSHPEIHIVWEDNNKIRYRSRTMSGIWGNQETVSTNNSHHPSIEVAGTNVYVVWEKFGDIYRKYAVYTNGSHYWTRYESFSTDYDLDYPVLSGGNAVSCVADVNGDYEIYFWYNAGVGWVGPINISNNPDATSDYPHIVHKQTVLGTTVYFTWTENNNPPYDVRFDNYTFGGSNPDENLAFYIAEGGEIEASPFNRRRGGYTQYGPEFFKKIDYDSEYLEYKFEKLNPAREYALAAYLYHEDNNHLSITVRVDNTQIDNITLPPDSLIICKEMLPENLYADGAVSVKIFGNKAVSAVLVLYEYEEESGKGGGGPQSADNALFGSEQLMLNVFPNPVQKELTIQYTLPKEDKVNLAFFDVSGRLVSKLINSHQNVGSYSKTFDTRTLSQGVYFIRLNAGEQSRVQKVVFLR